MHDHPATGTLPEGAARLTDWGVIRARGADAASFLHGQLTQDNSQLTEGRAALAGYCSPKGRLLATFVVWPDRQGDLMLACSADVLPATLKRLSMFVLRARCQLSDASAEVELWGVAGPASCRTLGEAARIHAWSSAALGDATVIGLPAAQVSGQGCPRVLLAQSVGGSATRSLPEMPLPIWLALEACSGVARVVAATSDRFVPQMVNFELVGGVNFKKGCYPGQEVVARSQYRGTVKRRAVLLHAGVPLTAAQDVYSAADPGQPAGTVALAGMLPGEDHIGLVELKLAALDEGSLHLGAPDGPALQPDALPYDLTEHAA